MYRVGIVTIEDCYNFGNRLQNLAMQRLLNNLGYEVKTFHRNYSELANISMKMYLKILLGRYHRISKYFLKRTFIYQRFYNFYLFNKRYIKWDRNTWENASANMYLEKNYEAFVVGSDQVWNFEFDFNTKENLFGQISSNIRKISVAASIGVTKLSGKEMELFKEYLNNFDAVSVREKTAIPLLQPYYKGEIVQIKDPTLLVGRKYWEDILHNSRLRVKKQYLLCFFLSPVSDAVSTFCDELEKSYGLQVIQLNDVQNSYYGIGPIDFLKIIHDAEYILTDSFHCSVFSILFQKRFSIYDRNTDEMDSSNRTDELLELFKMEYAKNIYSVDEMVRQIPMSGAFIDTILDLEKKKAEEFMKESLRKGKS